MEQIPEPSVTRAFLTFQEKIAKKITELQIDELRGDILNLGRAMNSRLRVQEEVGLLKIVLLINNMLDSKIIQHTELWLPVLEDWQDLKSQLLYLLTKKHKNMRGELLFVWLRNSLSLSSLRLLGKATNEQENIELESRLDYFFSHEVIPARRVSIATKIVESPVLDWYWPIITEILWEEFEKKYASWPELMTTEQKHNYRPVYLPQTFTSLLLQSSGEVVKNLYQKLSIVFGLPLLNSSEVQRGWQMTATLSSRQPPDDFLEHTNTLFEQHLFTALEIAKENSTSLELLVDKFGITQFGSYGTELLNTLIEHDSREVSQRVVYLHNRFDYNAARMMRGFDMYHNSLTTLPDDIGGMLVEFNNLEEARVRLSKLCEPNSIVSLVVESHGNSGSLHIYNIENQTLGESITNEFTKSIAGVYDLDDLLTYDATIVLNVCYSESAASELAQLIGCNSYGSTSLSRLSSLEFYPEFDGLRTKAKFLSLVNKSNEKNECTKYYPGVKQIDRGSKK